MPSFWTFDGATGLVLFLLGQLVRQDRDEHDVVDAEHDFERQERHECTPRFGIREPFHGGRG